MTTSYWVRKARCREATRTHNIHYKNGRHWTFKKNPHGGGSIDEGQEREQRGSEANKQKQTLQIKNITKNLIYFTYLSYVYACLTVS